MSREGAGVWGSDRSPERERRVAWAGGERRGPALALGALRSGAGCTYHVALVIRTIPLAYFLTWTTYGSWLHGDERGSVDSLHNMPRTPRLPGSLARHAHGRSLLKSAPVVLSDDARAVVDRVVREHAQVRAWKVLALNVRTNHVHGVIGVGIAEPERVMVELKAWSTRRLREAGLFAPDARVWTKHGSTRRLFDDGSVSRACEYVAERQ